MATSGSIRLPPGPNPTCQAGLASNAEGPPSVPTHGLAAHPALPQTVSLVWFTPKLALTPKQSVWLGSTLL